MAVRHRERPHVDVPFHPESILAEGGKEMIRNFLATCDACHENGDWPSVTQARGGGLDD